MNNDVVILKFDPRFCKCGYTRLIFQDEIALQFYLLWRKNHLVSDVFPRQVLQIIDRFKINKPGAKKDFIEDIQSAVGCNSLDFPPKDVAKFVIDYLPYYKGERKIRYELFNSSLSAT